MRTLRLRRDSTLCRVLSGLLIFGFAANGLANPTGLTVTHGTATTQQSGSQLTITASQNAFLNWNTFNIAAGETTTFVQPSSTSIVWNRVNDPNPSQIFGSIQANGVVVLLNSSGFYFGPNSFVSAAGLVVSTANCAPPENSGGTWEFNGPPPLASIVNYGRIQVGNGGSAFLIADQVENHGTIEAPGGSIGLAAGQTVLLSERPDGRGMSLQVTLPQGSVDNSGNLIADAGTIALNAKVVNQNGLVQANSVQNNNGVIELVAADSLTLGASSQILAQGDAATPGSSGGTVTLQSQNNFSDTAGSQISVTGGAQGGNGGSIEVSAPNVLSLASSMDASAPAGWNSGTFFLDPVNIILGTSTAGGAIDVTKAFANFSTILLQATGNITLNAGTAWDLSASTGQNSGQLTLEAGGNITFNSSSSLGAAKITDANHWSVTLAAGYDFVNNSVLSGVGSILLNGGTGGGLISTAAGNVSLTAGQNITLGSGYVNTTGGGSIAAHALAGNINTGSYAQGYTFQSATTASGGYYVDASKGLGGMSTAAGGDVSLIAGGNVSSFLPVKGGAQAGSTAGSGAYGSAAGNVTVLAGGNVTGSYLVANGIGSIYAGVIMDAAGNPVTDGSGNYVLGATGSAGSNPSAPNLALSLIAGGWNVTAAQNIILQEVRNPNGVFNGNNSGAKHTFDYASDAFVNLTAGNLIQLGGAATALPRSTDLPGLPVIYPPILNISAGAGGVNFYGDATFNQLILFPSPQGSLTINTTQGGSLVSNLAPLNGTPQIFNLIVSDSGKTQYKTSGDFGLNDHATTPVHLDNPTPITLNISGDMSLVLLGAPEAAQITIGGDMMNSRFQGMNLAASDVTRITVAGDIVNRSAFTSVDLNNYAGTAAPDLSYLAQALSSNPTATTLVSSFYYDATTGQFTYQNIPGQTLASVLQLLQNLPIQVYKNGVPQWVDANQTIPVTTTVAVINAATAQALQAQYNLLNVASGLPAAGGPPSGTAGLTIGGGGKFDISAQNIDLGTTAGIVSKGAGLYRVGTAAPLASLFDIGADISVTTTGDLNMFSSAIASLNGGGLVVNAGGNINVGSPDFTVNSPVARGIYSTSGSDVAVYANQNINLNGSRIAAFDGGNVTVESYHGDINVGVGGLGGVTLTAYYVDPVTHILYQTSPGAFGSGILAETFGPRDSSYLAPDAVLGNILVETPNGNVNANSAGVLQLAFNHVDYPNATVEVFAGYELRDGAGNPLTAAQIGSGTAVPVFSSQNVVTLGTPIQVTPAGTTTPISLTPVLDAKGQPVLAANGQPLYIQTADTKQQIVEFASQVIQPYLDSGGNDVSVAKPLDANKNPYLDGNGNPILVIGRNIDASNSGVIAQNATLQATGDVKGAIFAKGNINVAAVNNVNVTALAQGMANVSAGGTLSGNIIGIGGITASGGSVDASLLSNAGISGTTSGQNGFAQGTAANATAQADQSEDVAKTADASEGDGSDDEQKKKKPVALAQKVGRVTVLLPTKTN